MSAYTRWTTSSLPLRLHLKQFEQSAKKKPTLPSPVATLARRAYTSRRAPPGASTKGQPRLFNADLRLKTGVNSPSATAGTSRRQYPYPEVSFFWFVLTHFVVVWSENRKKIWISYYIGRIYLHSKEAHLVLLLERDSPFKTLNFSRVTTEDHSISKRGRANQSSQPASDWRPGFQFVGKLCGPFCWSFFPIR